MSHSTSWPFPGQDFAFFSTTPCFSLLKLKPFGSGRCSPGWSLSLILYFQHLSVEGQAISTPAAFYRGRKCAFIQHVASGEINRQNSCLHEALPHLSSGSLQEATAQLSARRMCLYRYLQKGEVEKRIWKCLMLSTYQQSSLCSS